MRTGGSIQVARIFGIRIGVTPSWLVVLFLFILNLSSYFRAVLGGSSSRAYAVAVAAVLLFYVSIVLHELGHALVARRQGIEVVGIDLWFFGGLAQVSRDPATPGAEFAVAVAGPLVTLVIAVGCGLAAALVGTSAHLFDILLFRTSFSTSPGYALLSFLAAINAFLLAFNLLPGFPLDGGRLALAAAWKVTGTRDRGLRFAGRTGLLVAYGLGGWGLYRIYHGDLFGAFTLVLAFMLAGPARAASLGGAVRERLSAITVADVMDPRPFAIHDDVPLIEARDEFLEPNGWPFVPLVDEHGRFAGVLERDAAEREIAAGRPTLPSRDVAAAPPGTWEVGCDQPLEALLRSESLQRIGAVFAVDAQGMLRGVVTLDQLRRALGPAGAR